MSGTVRARHLQKVISAQYVSGFAKVVKYSRKQEVVAGLPREVTLWGTPGGESTWYQERFDKVVVLACL